MNFEKAFQLLEEGFLIRSLVSQAIYSKKDGKLLENEREVPESYITQLEKDGDWEQSAEYFKGTVQEYQELYGPDAIKQQLDEVWKAHEFNEKHRKKQ